MDIQKLKDIKQQLITASNPEWQDILELRSAVQKEFQDHESLSIPTFAKILNWRLEKESQAQKIINSTPADFLKNITHCYYKTDYPHDELKIKIKMHILLSIPWIGIGIASAIMALHEPHLYGTIDVRSWSSLFQQHKKTLAMNDYMKYLETIRPLAEKAGCDVQEIDYILWKLDAL